MADVQPFRGFRYDLARVGQLGDVVAPPYDVIDAPLRVAFSLRESASGFEFDARVRSKTGGAHPDQLILAIEFVPNAAQRESSERLADALYGPVAAMTRG